MSWPGCGLGAGEGALVGLSNSARKLILISAPRTMTWLQLQPLHAPRPLLAQCSTLHNSHDTMLISICKVVNVVSPQRFVWSWAWAWPVSVMPFLIINWNYACRGKRAPNFWQFWQPATKFAKRPQSPHCCQLIWTTVQLGNWATGRRLAYQNLSCLVPPCSILSRQLWHNQFGLNKLQLEICKQRK